MIAMAGVIAIPGSVYDTIARFYRDNIPTEKPLGDLRNLVESVLPAYHDAIAVRGMDPYVWSPVSSANGPLLDHLVSSLSIPRDTIQDVLFSAESCAASGAIDGRYWRPDTYQDTRPPSVVDTVFAPVNQTGSAIAAGLNSLSTKMLVLGGLVVLVVIANKVPWSAFVRNHKGGV